MDCHGLRPRNDGFGGMDCHAAVRLAMTDSAAWIATPLCGLQ
jgi:hypothetical protein